MRIGRRLPRALLACGLAAALVLAYSASLAWAEQAAPYPERQQAAMTGATAAGSGGGTDLLFRIEGGGHLLATSSSYDRAQVAPLVSAIDAFPHGSELSKLSLDVATPGEVAERCGEETMACYDPWENEMVIDGQNEALEGVSRTSLMAHEYGHHIANNREGGIWSAFDAGTPRWSTYEEVCERTREGTLSPGNEGLHYWENPGEAFAQTYATLVEPGTLWLYTPLLAPDETALRKVQEDVLSPVVPRRMRWRVGSPPGRDPAISDALPVGHGSFKRTLRAPYDGRIAIHLNAEADGRYRLSLRDASTGELLSQGPAGTDGESRLRYADCGHRLIEVRAEAIGVVSGFTAEILAP